MGVFEECPGGIGNEVNTDAECREAARYLRLPIGQFGQFAGFFPAMQRNCYVASNIYGTHVWFNTDKRREPTSRCGPVNHVSTTCAAVCRGC